MSNVVDFSEYRRVYKHTHLQINFPDTGIPVVQIVEGADNREIDSKDVYVLLRQALLLAESDIMQEVMELYETE